MTAQRGKPEQPTDDDWRRAIDAFKHYRNLDRKDFRERVKQLPLALKHAADNVRNAAARVERKEGVDLSAHDAAALILLLEKKGYTEQLAIAGLDLLHLDQRALPTRAIVVVTPDEVAKGRIEDWRDRVQSGVDEQEVARRLRLQAERLRDGATRVQRCLSDYKQRLAAIKPATSVAWDSLFEMTEQRGVQPKEIAKRLADGVRHPKMNDDYSHDDHVTLWHENARTRLSDWRDRHPKRRSKK